MRKYFFHSFWNSHSLSLETMRCYNGGRKAHLICHQRTNIVMLYLNVATIDF